MKMLILLGLSLLMVSVLGVVSDRYSPLPALCSPGLIDLNRASKAQLETLPYIGESRANAIIIFREPGRGGPFASREDVKKVPGIDEGIYDRIKCQIKV